MRSWRLSATRLVILSSEGSWTHPYWHSCWHHLRDTTPMFLRRCWLPQWRRAVAHWIQQVSAQWPSGGKLKRWLERARKPWALANGPASVMFLSMKRIGVQMPVDIRSPVCFRWQSCDTDRQEALVPVRRFLPSAALATWKKSVGEGLPGAHCGTKICTEGEGPHVSARRNWECPVPAHCREGLETWRVPGNVEADCAKSLVLGGICSASKRTLRCSCTLNFFKFSDFISIVEDNVAFCDLV